MRVLPGIRCVRGDPVVVEAPFDQVGDVLIGQLLQHGEFAGDPDRGEPAGQQRYCRRCASEVGDRQVDAHLGGFLRLPSQKAAAKASLL